MHVGKSVQKAIDEWEAGDLESAMLHACNAVDGTAKKVFPNEPGGNMRFTTLIRTNYDLYGPMAAPGVNLADTRFNVRVQRPKAQGGSPDIADVIYGIHRCSHGHGDALPDGFELTRDAHLVGVATMRMGRDGTARLSDRTIFGLLALVVAESVNLDQFDYVPNAYRLTFEGQILFIRDWWGEKDEMRALLQERQMPNVVLDLVDWQDRS